MMETFHFLRPDWFYALIPLAIILYFSLAHSVSSMSWKKICDEKLLPFILIEGNTSSSRIPYILISLATLLCITTAAGPVWEKLPTPVFREQSSLVIALDLSRSMDSSDIRPTRLKRAKLKVLDILRKRKGGQTALIAYAANAFTVTPLTTDSATIANLISALDTEIMPAQGSNAGNALKLANNLLAQSGITSGDVLLVTDSVNKGDFVGISALSENNHRLSILGFYPVLTDEYAIKEYQTFNLFLIHADCYRIEQESDAESTGLLEYINRDDAIIVIEWAEKIKSILPENTIKIRFENMGGDGRRIKVAGLGSRGSDRKTQEK